MKAPEFKLPYIDQDKYYDLKDDLGKIVVLTFWTSWCPECSIDLPIKEKLHQTIESDKIRFITINVAGRERTPDDGGRFYHEFLNQPTLVDNGLEVYRKYQCKGVPTTVIIDQTGMIITQITNQAKPLDIMQAISPYI